MKRTIGVVTLLFTLVAGWILLQPGEAVGFDCIRCPRFFATTPTEWGESCESCAAANNNAISAAWSHIQCYTCDDYPEEITPCYWDDNLHKYRAAWRIRYKCEINLCY